MAEYTDGDGAADLRLQSECDRPDEGRETPPDAYGEVQCKLCGRWLDYFIRFPVCSSCIAYGPPKGEGRGEKR